MEANARTVFVTPVLDTQITGGKQLAHPVVSGTEIRRLIAQGIAPAVKGWGRLLATLRNAYGFG